MASGQWRNAPRAQGSHKVLPLGMEGRNGRKGDARCLAIQPFADPPFAICYLPFAICCLLFAICYLLFAICYLPFALATRRLPLATHRISCPPVTLIAWPVM